MVMVLMWFFMDSNEGKSFLFLLCWSNTFEDVIGLLLIMEHSLVFSITKQYFYYIFLKHEQLWEIKFLELCKRHVSTHFKVLTPSGEFFEWPLCTMQFKVTFKLWINCQSSNELLLMQDESNLDLVYVV